MSESIVERKPRPRNRVFIKLSGGRFFTVPESEALHGRGAVLTEEKVERLSRVDQYFRGYDKAIRLLSIRPRTRHEIKKALVGLELQAAIRDSVIERLEEKGLIDDRRFTNDYVRSRVEIKGFGPHRLKFDLKKLGVHEDIVDEVLQREVTAQSQELAAWDIVRKKLGNRKPQYRHRL